MPRKGLLLSIIDLDQALNRPNGGSQRFRLFLDAAVAACSDVKLIACNPNMSSVLENDRVAALIQQKWGLRVDVKQVMIPPSRFSNTNLFISPIFRASVHPEFSRCRCESVQSAMLDEMSLDPDIVIVRGQALADCFLRLFGSRNNACLDIDDIGHKKFARMVDSGEIWGPKWLNSLQIRSRKEYERSVISRFSVSFVCSETDALYCRKKLCLDNVRIAPNALPEQEPMALTKSHTLLMVGNLSYAPNAKGLQLFAEQILPELMKQFSDVELLVAGDISPAIRQRYEGVQRIKLFGFVEDLDAVYASSRIVVCPIVSGGGTRVKLIEAAMRGKAIVTTSVGAEGLKFVDQKHVLIADSPSLFSCACSRLLVDDALASWIGVEARKLACDCFSFNAVRDQLAELFRASLSPQNRQIGRENSLPKWPDRKLGTEGT